MKKITHKQLAFVNHYCTDAKFNATKAATLAGYSEKTAYSIGCELLKKPEILQIVDDKLQADADQFQITAQEIASRLNRIALSCEHHGKHNDAIRANELLGRYKAMFVDKSVNMNANMDIPTEPVKYRAWLKSELERLKAGDKVKENYAKTEPAIAKR